MQQQITKESRRSIDLCGQRSPGGRKQSGQARAAREGSPECTGLELGPTEPESTEQAVSDKVPGKGSGINKELGRASDQAALNRRLHGGKIWKQLGHSGVWWCLGHVGEPWKLCEVSATPDCQEVKTRKNLLEII